MIAQVGPYPPPLGGIAMYIKRIKHALDSLGVKNTVLDTSKTEKHSSDIIRTKFRFLSVPFYCLFNSNYKLIHYNIPGVFAKYYFALFNLGPLKDRKSVLTLHGDPKSLFRRNRRLMTFALNSFNSIICVKQSDKQYLKSCGVLSEIHAISPFIPPSLNSFDNKIPDLISAFISKHKPIVVANASKIVIRQGIDLYGIDMCIDLCSKLKNDFPDIGFIFCLPQISDNNYFDFLRGQIQKYNISDNFLFSLKPVQLHPIIKKCHIFVRPTSTDGDSISIREALHLMIPSIASDAVQRPIGTILFRNRDINDFYSTTKNVLRNFESHKAKLTILDKEDNFNKLFHLYRQLIPFIKSASNN